MKNVVVRSLSGAVYVALIVAAILCGPSTFFLLTGLFVVFGMIEFESMIKYRCDGQDVSALSRCIDIVAALAIWSIVPISYFGVWIINASPEDFLDVPGFVMMLGILGMAFFIAGLFLVLILSRFVLSIFDPGLKSVSSLAQSILGIFYITVPMCLLNLVAFVPGSFSKHFLLFTFVLIWLNDTGAYCVGSKFGKRRLFERLSPKKSWEGFWGGFGFCVAAGIIYALCSGQSVA
ncbi:MAG: phosphatidate cytidylyltransferase, partial [Muribaculaceae bacterium]|nr:phosphatidate cytidylyltransferase [Muribaculaceae bacterium]